jgi:hypothetical protein
MEKIPLNSISYRGSVAETTRLFREWGERINYLIDKVEQLEAKQNLSPTDGVHGAGGPYFNVVHNGEVVKKVRGKSNAEEEYEKLVAAE